MRQTTVANRLRRLPTIVGQDKRFVDGKGKNICFYNLKSVALQMDYLKK